MVCCVLFVGVVVGVGVSVVVCCLVFVVVDGCSCLGFLPFLFMFLLCN